MREQERATPPRQLPARGLGRKKRTTERGESSRPKSRSCTSRECPDPRLPQDRSSLKRNGREGTSPQLGKQYYSPRRARRIEVKVSCCTWCVAPVAQPSRSSALVASASSSASNERVALRLVLRTYKATKVVPGHRLLRTAVSERCNHRVRDEWSPRTPEAFTVLINSVAA